MTVIRLYADTSIFGGVFDDEFAVPSRQLFAGIKEGRFHLMVSPLVQEELETAPTDVVKYYERMLPSAEVLMVTPDALALQQAYLDAGILTPKSATDALHVALATTSRCAMIVSWNFRHIVHFDKIAMYNGVNVANGLPTIGIHSPREVIVYEDEDI
jgi:predicted nucleic acid-binding protein